MAARDLELDPSHAQAVAGGELRLLDPLIVHKRAVCAFQIDHLHRLVARGQAAVDPRHQRGINDEIGTSGPADGLDGAARQAECQRVLLATFAFLNRGTLEDPHRPSILVRGSTASAADPSNVAWAP